MCLKPDMQNKGIKFITAMLREAAENYTVPVCIHLDHATEIEDIKEAIDNGFTSVMYDGSVLSFSENAAKTKEVVDLAHAKGVSVEAELGHVGGGEGGTDDGHEEMYTRVDQVVDFNNRSEVDALAVAIGTAHGKYKTKPVLDINRLAQIYEVSDKPLVLHGGSGLSNDDFRNTIANGIRKINVCTEMCVAAREAYIASANHEILFTDAKNAVKNVVKGKMQLFGSSNKA